MKQQNPSSVYHVGAWASSLWIRPIHCHSIPDIADWRWSIVRRARGDIVHPCICPWQRSLDRGLQRRLHPETIKTTPAKYTDRPNLKGNRRIWPHRWEQHVGCRGGVLLGCGLVGHVEVVHGRGRSGGASGGRGGGLGAVDVRGDRAAVQHLHLPELGFPAGSGRQPSKSRKSTRNSRVRALGERGNRRFLPPGAR